MVQVLFVLAIVLKATFGKVTTAEVVVRFTCAVICTHRSLWKDIEGNTGRSKLLMHHASALMLGAAGWWWLTRQGLIHMLLHARRIQMLTMVLVALDTISVVNSILVQNNLLRGALAATWWWPLVVVKIVLDSPVWLIFLRMSIQCAASWYVGTIDFNVPSLIVFVWGVAWFEYSRRNEFLTLLRITSTRDCNCD